MPRFSIVIPHRNGSALLRCTIGALSESTGPDDEVFVVDNGSSDGSQAMLRGGHPDINLIENGCNNGFARACNQAIRAAKGRYILLLNNDALLPAGALDTLAADFEAEPRAGAIGARLIGPDGAPQRSRKPLPTPWSEIGLRRQERDVPREGGLAEVESVIGACLALRREALDEVGLLDERFFFFFEETELCLRLRQNGWKVLLDERIRVVHERGASVRRVSREARLELFRSRLVYYRAAFAPTTAAALIVYRVLRLAINWLFALLATLLTLGRHPASRERLSRYGHTLAWLLRGCPREWGLPGKCPEGASMK